MSEPAPPFQRPQPGFISARITGTVESRQVHALTPSSVTVFPPIEGSPGSIARLTLTLGGTLELSLRVVVTAPRDTGGQVLRAADAEAISLLGLACQLANVPRRLSLGTPPVTLRRPLIVRLAVDQDLRDVAGVDDDGFAIEGPAIPAGVWTMATFAESQTMTVRIPVIAGGMDSAGHQAFAVVTHEGRRLLGLLAAVAELPRTGLDHLPTARVLPPSVPFRRLHSSSLD